jgi:hypothetical protein
MAMRNATSRERHKLGAVCMVAAVLVGLLAGTATATETSEDVTVLSGEDFTYGTYIIYQSGIYRLAEDISFNPNSPDTLTAAVEDSAIPAELVQAMSLPSPVDAYHAGRPLFTQLVPGGVADFTPGGPLDARYDPAAFGVGFFAAIAITADDVVLDLAGHTIEQSPEHALLQRFFAVVELADQPFVPGQGPASFGTELEAAHRVTIKNGTIGRSSHHGIHGNANADVTVEGVDFVDYEVGAIALNGVDGLEVKNVTAVNRKDVPVIGTFSSARFIQAYIDHLVRSGSPTTLTVTGTVLSAGDVQASLRDAINNTHQDLVVRPNVVDGRAQIDPSEHPVEYGLFHNQSGLLDGNSYSFLVNNLGVAVDGFPSAPDGVTRIPSRNIAFENVRVKDQHAFINEVVAIDAGGTAAIDPVGAVFQIRNLHPDAGVPITISNTDDALARYVGNPVANAQALVAKAAALGEFEATHLDVSRSNIPASVLEWAEGQPGSETLADIGVSYYCNGDSMFHVNKGVIAFKMDAAENVRLEDTSVDGLVNLGVEGSTLCGDYLHGFSHPLANLYGYGGSAVRGYTFAGSTNVLVKQSKAINLRAVQGPAVGFDVMTDSSDVPFIKSVAHNVVAGSVDPMDPSGSTPPAKAIGFRVSAKAHGVTIDRGCAEELSGARGAWFLYDESETVVVSNTCATATAG